jgi:hypothetical protein
VCCERETERQALIRPFCSPFQVRRQELHARDCILQAPYTVSNQVLRDHDEERNLQLFTYVQPYHTHLDDIGNLPVYACASVEEVLLATQSGICEDGAGRRLRGRGHADRELLRASVVCEQQQELTCKWSVLIRAYIHLYTWSHLEIDTIPLFVRRQASALRASAPRAGTPPASSLTCSPSSPLQTASYPRTQPACSIPESRTSSRSSGTAQVRARRSARLVLELW